MSWIIHEDDPHWRVVVIEVLKAGATVDVRYECTRDLAVETSSWRDGGREWIVTAEDGDGRSLAPQRSHWTIEGEKRMGELRFEAASPEATAVTLRMGSERGRASLVVAL